MAETVAILGMVKMRSISGMHFSAVDRISDYRFALHKSRSLMCSQIIRSFLACSGQTFPSMASRVSLSVAFIPFVLKADTLESFSDGFARIWTMILEEALQKTFEKYAVEFQVRYGQAILRAVLLACCKICEFGVIANQVTEITDICRRDKAAGYQIVLEDIRDPLYVLLLGFFRESP